MITKKETIIVSIISLTMFSIGYFTGNANKEVLQSKLQYCNDSLSIANDKLLSIQKEISLKENNGINDILQLSDQNRELSNNIKTAHNLNKKYLQKIENLKKLLGNRFLKAKVLEKIENLDDYEIANLSKSFFRVNINDLPTHMSPKQIVNKLIDIALDDTYGNYNPSLNIKHIIFANSDNTTVDDSTYDNTDINKNKKVYAIFDTSNISDKTVLVKWVNKDTGELVLYDFYKINPNSNRNYIWIKNNKGLKTGDYQVEIFSPSKDFNPIFYGQFYVK